jgi:hypothetical protein
MKDFRNPLRNGLNQRLLVGELPRVLGQLAQHHFTVVSFAKKFPVEPRLELTAQAAACRNGSIHEHHNYRQQNDIQYRMRSRLHHGYDKAKYDKRGNPKFKSNQSRPRQQIFRPHAQQDAYIHRPLHH